MTLTARQRAVLATLSSDEARFLTGPDYRIGKTLVRKGFAKLERHETYIGGYFRRTEKPAP